MSNWPSLQNFHFMAVWKWQYLDIEDRVFHKFGTVTQKKSTHTNLFYYDRMMWQDPYNRFHISNWLSPPFFFMAVWKWQYLDIEDGVFQKFGTDPQKNLKHTFILNTWTVFNRNSSIDFKCQIDRALNSVHFMGVWKWQYLDIEDRVFHKFGTDPQKNLNLYNCFTTV